MLVTVGVACFLRVPCHRAEHAGHVRPHNSKHLPCPACFTHKLCPLAGWRPLIRHLVSTCRPHGGRIGDGVWPMSGVTCLCIGTIVLAVPVHFATQ